MRELKQYGAPEIPRFAGVGPLLRVSAALLTVIKRKCLVVSGVASVLIAVALLTFAADDSTFRAGTTMVLVPFNVQRDKSYVVDLQRSDFVLFENGHAREFTIFERPNAPHPLPLQLILLFDTSRLPSKNPYGQITSSWNPRTAYEFLNNWDEAAIRNVLDQSGTEVRVSVYHFDDGHLERLCGPTRDSSEIGGAFRKLLNPIPGQNQLALLPGNGVHKGWITTSQGWWQEATLATLRDASATGNGERRMMLPFSDLIGGSVPTRGGVSRPWRMVASDALAAGIEIDPVIVDTRRGTSTNPMAGLPGSSVNAPGGRYPFALLPLAGEVGAMTGGEVSVLIPVTRDALTGVLQRIRNRALTKYLVGFIPDAAAKPGKHNLEIRLKSKDAGKIVGGEREGVVY